MSQDHCKTGEYEWSSYRAYAGAGLNAPVAGSASRYVLNHVQYTPPDFEDVNGQEHAKRGIEVATAGSHNVLTL